MTFHDAGTEALIDRAAAGDAAARELLLLRHQERLRKMVALRLDRRLAPRVDPSDVVQEALAEAARRLPDYLDGRPIPFYPWLRRLAWDRLLKLHRSHLGTGKRSVRREEPQSPALPDESVAQLADRLAGSGTSPSGRVVRDELRARVRAALEGLGERDREVLVLRYLEQLSTAEIAGVLEISEGAVKVRHLRALQRLRAVLGDDPEEGRP